jgi:DNA primase
LAREYLEQRGLDAAIEPWRLGHHPAPGALSRHARERNLSLDVLEQAGLLKNGREIFAGRVMFPIDDERGRTVGFGGRLVPGAPGSEPDGDYKPPKYLNSPESPFFSKRRVLFGLHRTKQAGQRRIVVMEGYTDVIACHLAGFTGAVASLGTAFTADHAKTVERYATEGIVLMFDGDRAGVQAAERAMRELVNSRLPVRIALMSDAEDGSAKDPADVVTARAGEDPELVAERRARFADVIDGAEDALAVWFRLLRRRLDLSKAVNVEAAAGECAGLLGLVESPVRQAALTQEMARHLAVPAPTLERLLARTKRRPGPGDRAAEAGVAAQAVEPPASLLQRAEADLLACLLAEPDLLVSHDITADGPLESADLATLLAMATDGVALGRSTTDELLKYLFARAAEQPALLSLLGTAHARAAKIPEPETVLVGLLEGRRRLRGGPQRRVWRQQLQQALTVGDSAAAAELQQRLLDRMRLDRPREAAPADQQGSARASHGAPASGPTTPSPPQP